MLTLRHTIVPTLSLLILSADMFSAHAQTNYPITNFTKTNNIYTNLNEQFPNTGMGVPGSGVGTYGIDEDSFVLSSAFADQTLDSISISANGNNPIVLGVTVTGETPAATPEPGALALLSGIACTGLACFRRSRIRSQKG